MGELNVKIAKEQSKREKQHFVQQLLNDVEALDYMLKNDWFERDITRIGAEQELCLINKYYKPAYKAMDILKDFHPEWLTTELAQFNLELNLKPQVFEKNAFTLMESELRNNLTELEKVANKHGSKILLTGILPSLRKFDLNFDTLTPLERYRALMTSLKELRGSDYELRIDGIDELKLRHDSPLLEASNTSFQIHLQVSPDKFVKMYNIAQAITGPSIAMAANSPMLFGKRLWHETRIALFQQSIDSRASLDHFRQKHARVSFGSDWINDSVLDIHKKDILRHRVLLAADIEHNSLEQIAQGITPKLKALQVHNGTVYRWNRPCYGISPNGKPHLRIENRVFAAGPTVVDEMANTAYWLGLMQGMALETDDIRQNISFDDVRDNFLKGSKYGIDSKFTWFNNEKITARDLTTEVLLPIARRGLEAQNIDTGDIDNYLGIIEERVKSHMNGARWILKTYSKFKEETHKDESLTALTSAIFHNQKKSLPVHKWPIPELEQFDKYNPSALLAEEFMSTDFSSVQSDDLATYAASLMEWSNMEYLPVEDAAGKLLGIITAKAILKSFSKRSTNQEETIVADLMEKATHVIKPRMSIIDIIKLMKKHKLKFLPVVNTTNELMGLVTEQDFISMSKQLIERLQED
jgi:CBS domain-containing protein/gamma-glutamylcysteine synthetase